MIQMCKSEVLKDFDKTRLCHTVHGRGFVVFFFKFQRRMVNLQCCVHFCYTKLYTIFFFIIVYHRILNIIPHTIQQDLLFILSIHTSLHLLIPNSQSLLPDSPPPPTTNLFSIFVSLFFFPQVHLCHILHSTYK